MDLRARMARVALARPAVMVVAGPGATRERLAVEAELARRRWRHAASPAAANLVVFAGAPVRVREDNWAERVWGGVPAPRARVTVTEAEHAAHALDHGHAMLLRAHVDQPAGHASYEAPDHGDHRDHAGMDHGHHGHHMGVVAGLPMAERADDRDGLRLDRLHVPLGPALPDWPAGLVLRLELQGDVVQRAEVEATAAPAPSRPAFWDEPWLRALAGEPVTVGEAARRRCAAHLDSVGRLLHVAGWDDAALRAREARDLTLGGAPGDELGPRVRRLVRRVRGSWTLRWLLAGVGARTDGPVAEDAHGRLTAWLDAIEHALGDLADRAPLADRPPVGPRGPVGTGTPPSRALLDALPELLAGTEFACARLVVASLDPDLDELTPESVPGGHGHG
ncbi:hypothetical protein AB0C77_04850 [Streptomyces sp. NPDC048629]|uniref:hypothetical protein n=1 Tax=Streptomyces sp. NPDC048629 TaxID=3154824 RepID=UPI00341ABF2E